MRTYWSYLDTGEASGSVLDGFFEPRAVAVVGAAREPGKVGHFVLENLVSAGFQRPIYPVNPNATEILGLTCYGNVGELPGPCDLAVVVVPAAAVPGVIDECAAAHIDSVIVISAGFKESGPAGGALEREALARARSGGVRLLGPNCLGLIASGSKLNASFAQVMAPPGAISFMSQSGALGTAILDYAAGEGIGLANFVSLGNKADLTEVDLLRAWDADPATSVIVAYIESVTDGRLFVETAGRVSARTPVIAIKSGRSDAGARAVSSHTGSLAGSRVAYDAAFDKAGIIRAHDVQELFDLAAGFSRQPLPCGPGVALLTNAGGPAVLATDACEAAGLTLASLENETIDVLRGQLPPAAALYNPVDILGDATPERYRGALRALYRDSNVRAVIVILTPQAMTDPTSTARAIVEEAAVSGITTFASFMGRDSVEEAWGVLREGTVPSFPFPERAVATLAAMNRYVAFRSRPKSMSPPVRGDSTRVQALLDETRAAGRSFATEQAAAEIADAYGLRVPAGGVARGLARVRELAARIGYPVVMKIASPDILHKSDVGGILTGIADEEELAQAYETIVGRARAYAPEAIIHGVHLQKQVAPGREVIVGVDRDPQFGPILMFGLGGVYVEVLKDVTFRLCPVTPREARDMVAEIRAYGLLRGARGEKPADIDAVVEAILGVSALVMDFPEIVELDINPLIVGNAGEGAFAADVRIGIGGSS
ncbi:MAG: acetate--CoA ligase family protein [Actinomycetota bacterium]|nr:acetate--CoA ligase family protein [Actinomycetota bacterium]